MSKFSKGVTGKAITTFCLEVYTTLSETEYVTGNYEAMALILNEVLAKANTFDDKLRPHYTLMCATAAQNNLESAIDIGFEVFLRSLENKSRRK